MFADRTSVTTMRANRLRLWLSSMAHTLLCALHRIGLSHARFADASCGSIRLVLLKIGAVVTTSMRSVKIALASLTRQKAHLPPVWTGRRDPPGRADAHPPTGPNRDQCPATTSRSRSRFAPSNADAPLARASRMPPMSSAQRYRPEPFRGCAEIRALRPRCQLRTRRRRSRRPSSEFP